MHHGNWVDGALARRARRSEREPDVSISLEEADVSNLIAVAYEDPGTARRVLDELGELGVEHAITMEDAVIVERQPDGKVKLHQTVKPAAVGATGGALWGGLIGLIFLAPFLGMAVGAASGGLAGAASDAGVDDRFLKQLGEDLQPGGAAMIVLVRDSTPDKVLPRISRYGGSVIHSSLSDEAEARLQDALSGAGAAH
jgi:uncharacterized membrane protein